VVTAPPVLIGVEKVVPRRRATSRRRARRRVAVVAGALLVAVAVAVPIVAGYAWDRSTVAPSAGGPGTNPGWSPRWAFQGIDGAIYVVPVPRGDCDV
jgi:hypothetical protein